MYESPEGSIRERKANKAVAKVQDVLSKQFSAYYEDEDQQTEKFRAEVQKLDSLLQQLDRIRECADDLEADRALREVLNILEQSDVQWLNWFPRFSQIILQEAGYPAASKEKEVS